MLAIGEKSNKRKGGDNTGREKVMKKLQTIAIGGECHTKIDLHSVKELGVRMLHAEADIVPPDTEKLVDEIEKEAK